MKKSRITTPDLVVLSLLSEKPMHGYELNQQLEWRQVRDWADVSRPQVYYSLLKLEKKGLIQRTSPSESKAVGPERQVYSVTNLGTSALQTGLSQDHWALNRERPPFLTWFALCSHADPEAVHRMIESRRIYLKTQIQKETDDLASTKNDSAEMSILAAQMITLTIRQFETELKWLDEIEPNPHLIHG